MTDKTLKTLIILFKTQQNLGKHIKKSLICSGLTLNEFAVLEALNHKGDLCVNEVLKYVLIPNSSMTYVINNLVNKALIEQYLNANDQRIKMLKLTSKGTAVFLKAYEDHYQYLRREFDVLSSDEEKELQNLLKKLGRSLERNL